MYNCEIMSASDTTDAGKDGDRMDCSKCQSMIEDFLHGNLPISERDEFVKHVRTCSVCMEELEVYHIVNSVVSQLDGDTDENIDYRAELGRMMTRSEGSYRFRRFLKFFAAAFMFVLGFVTYLLLRKFVL